MPNRFNDQVDIKISADENDTMWELLSIYADGEASPAEAARVEELLRSDAAYAQKFAFVKTASAAVQTFAELDPPASLRCAILTSTSQRITWATRLASIRDTVLGSAIPRYTLSLAGLAATGLLAFIVVQHNGRPNSISMTSLDYRVQSPRVANAGPSARERQFKVPVTNAKIQPEILSALPNAFRPEPPSVRRLVAVSMTNVNTKHVMLSPAVVTILKPKTSVAGHDDGTRVAVAVAYPPDKDAQFYRSSGSVTTPEPQTVEIAGDDVHIADTDPMSSSMPASKGTSAQTDSVTPAAQNNGPHVIVAKLTAALPPDSDQVLTRADMARNRAVMTAGYDRSTLKSMERKEASISLLRGTF